MSVQISKAASEKKIPLTRAQIQKILALTLRELKDTQEYKKFSEVLGTPRDLDLRFCDDAEMRGYQKQFRKLDRTTDILSFPSLESPDNCEQHFLGSVVISMATVVRNAARYQRPVKAELAEVVVHGILHLLSFDHVKVSVAKKTRMRQWQKEITLKALKLVK